ncbi:DinB family protein [Virgibacillus ihumii]|uniref:DinB family protein n=1 Tax=Virgibacillus ihumii TaxID=2686091 RepID=UPI00157DAB65|nr:DinB family protein [Virgibacillus ihumii]
MSELMYTQFNTTRNMLLKKISDLDPKNLDVQPIGFNNSIHWQLGHILTVTEQFMFGFPENTDNIPANYKDLFGPGSKPADWSDNVPSVEKLETQLKEQLERLNAIPAKQFGEKLPEPVLGNETVGELAVMAAFHEANHLGRIHSMEKVIKNQ